MNAAATESSPDISPRHLRAVLAVTEYRSFIAAAAYLKISQPALTRTIKQAETALGVTLYSRSTRQVTVTPAGKEFTAVAERLLNDLTISVGSIRQHAQHTTGQVVVASVYSLAPCMASATMAPFRSRYPGVQLHLREGIHRDVVDEVRSGAADFGIAYLESLPNGLLVESLATERFAVVLPSGHVLARTKRIDLAALRQETLLSFGADSQTRRCVDAATTAKGFALRYAVTANRLPTLLDLVRQGLGITILPLHECPDPEDHTLTSRPLEGSRLSCRLGLLRSRDRKLGAAAATLLVTMRRWMRTQRR